MDVLFYLATQSLSPLTICLLGIAFATTILLLDACCARMLINGAWIVLFFASIAGVLIAVTEWDR